MMNASLCNEMYQKIINQARIDSDFKERLANNYQLAIEELSDQKLQDNYQIKIINQYPYYEAMFTLPEAEFIKSINKMRHSK